MSKSFLQGLNMQQSLTRCVLNPWDFQGHCLGRALTCQRKSDEAQSPVCGVVVRAWVEMTLSFAGTVSALLSWKQMGPNVPLLAMQQQQERVTILASIFHANTFTQLLLIKWENNLTNLCFKICLRNMASGKFGMSNTFLWMWALEVFI